MKQSIAVIFLSVFLSCFVNTSLFCIEVEELTYDYLVQSPYTDHVQHFKKLFQQTKVNSFLEFGIGLGTKYFLDHCNEVTSYEIIMPDQTDEWFNLSCDLYKDHYDHWNPILKRGSDALHSANILSYRDRLDPSLHDATYLLDLKNYCDEIFAGKQYDVAFVDPGFHMRADLVNELFDRVPIIVAHDTNVGVLEYGWKKIHTPSNYEKIVFTEGAGTTFWIHHDKMDLILALGKAPETIVDTSKKLRLFFPQMHPILVQSFALVCQHLGHTLVLPGESFDPHSRHRGPKISYGTFFKKNPLDSVSYTSFFSEDPSQCTFLSKNIEVIENDEFFSNPPDVIFVNCYELQDSMYQIWARINHELHPSTRLVHYSGNNATPYNQNYVKNLIAVDAYTARYFDSSAVNILYWIPWIDYDTLVYEGTTDNLEINAYLRHYYNASMPSSYQCYRNIVDGLSLEFPDVTANLYPPSNSSFPYVRHCDVFPLINQSCATMHIKESEGFGYTIIESLAKGRPVFLFRPFSIGSRLMNWCIEGKTAFFVNDYNEFRDKFQKYMEDSEYRHQIQNECATTIRRLINNEKQARILDKFLHSLQ